MPKCQICKKKKDEDELIICDWCEANICEDCANSEGGQGMDPGFIIFINV